MSPTKWRKIDKHNGASETEPRQPFMCETALTAAVSVQLFGSAWEIALRDVKRA
jgi:hypothetical protein